MNTLQMLVGIAIGGIVTTSFLENTEEVSAVILERGNSLNEFNACKIANAKKGIFNFKNCTQLDWAKQ